MDSVERKVQLLLMARLHPGETGAILEGMTTSDLQEALDMIVRALDGPQERPRSEPPPALE